MAEALMKFILAKHGIDAIVHSAGVNAMVDHIASNNAILAMQQENIDIKSHSSRQISLEMLVDVNLILTMTERHLHIIKTMHPTANAFTLSQYAQSSGDISDPYGGDLETYLQCARQIHQLLLDSIKKLKEDLWKA